MNDSLNNLLQQDPTDVLNAVKAVEGTLVMKALREVLAEERKQLAEAVMNSGTTPEDLAYAQVLKGKYAAYGDFWEIFAEKLNINKQEDN